MVKEIRLYLGRDEKSGEMLEAFRRELNLLPRESRPKLRAKVLKLRDPSRFEQYVRELEELYGGLYVEEFKKYGIRAVPAVVVDGEKLFEGKYLSRDEIRALLGLQPAQPQPQPAPSASRPPQPPGKPVELTPVVLVQPEEEQLPELRVEPSPPPPAAPPVKVAPERAVPKQAPKAAPQPPPRATPRVEEPPEAPFVIEPVEVEPVKAPQPSLQRQQPVQQPVAPPRAAEPKKTEHTLQPAPPRPAAQPAPQVPAAKFSCYTCIHFNPERSRCRLLHIQVPDPNSPPCGRGRR